MTDDEILSARYDKNQSLPREHDRKNAGAPSLWDVGASALFDPPQLTGQYPRGFLDWAARALGVARHRFVHLCSGRLPPGEGRLRVDIRPEVRPDIVADCTRLPLRDGFADAVLIDPPYTIEYANDLYETGYPRPSRLLAEASRIAKPGAPVAMLHFLVPKPAPGLEFEAVYGVTTGFNYRIRAFTVWRKRERELF